MAELVSSAQVVAYLNLSASDPVALDLADAVEALLNEQCSRADHPFAPGGAQTEVHDGRGTHELFLHYPIATLTSIKLGIDPSDPDETLDITDANVLDQRHAGQRKLIRRDGVFGPRGLPRYVQVVYTSADDLPVSAGQAVLEMVGALYRRRGSEGVTAERTGGYSIEFGATGDMLALADVLPSWRSVVRSYGVHV